MAPRPLTRLTFVCGKGGVGRSTIAEALARSRAKKGERTLLCAFEDPELPTGAPTEIAPRLYALNCEASTAFEEYMGLKIGVPALAKLFVQNAVIQYLSRAAPGLRDLVLLGKVWFEMSRYEAVVVDMPATGHGIAMFQSTVNFARLFQGGPLHQDAVKMLTSLRDPSMTTLLIVALPEETPLRESLELSDSLGKILEGNSPRFLCNRRFPGWDLVEQGADAPPDSATSPFASDVDSYIARRLTLERQNLEIWRAAGVPYVNLPYVNPSVGVPEQLEEHFA